MRKRERGRRGEVRAKIFAEPVFHRRGVSARRKEGRRERAPWAQNCLPAAFSPIAFKLPASHSRVSRTHTHAYICARAHDGVELRGRQV